jgi:hypothetical protein
MPPDPFVVATLVVLAVIATPLTADVRRRRVARRFDAVYERNLLRRTGRGQAGHRPPSPHPEAVARRLRRPGQGRRPEPP